MLPMKKSVTFTGACANEIIQSERKRSCQNQQFSHTLLYTKYYNLIENQTNVYISIFQQKIVNLVPSIYFSDCLGDLVFTTVAIYGKVMLTFLAHTHSHFPYICTSFAMNYGSYSYPRFYAIYFLQNPIFQNNYCEVISKRILIIFAPEEAEIFKDYLIILA